MSQDPILRTRLFIPPFKSDYLSRPRLINLINQGMKDRLVFISAPAGYGKTTLIAEWVAHRAMPAAWISLDHSIHDATTLLNYAITSLQNIIPGIGKGVQKSLTTSPNSPVKTLAHTFINEICDLQQDITLVLDDFHTLENSDSIQLISDIIHNQPPHLHLLIASRSDLPFSYERTLCRGEMTILGINELRFKPQEAHDYLISRLKNKISLKEREILLHQTEGWIAGLQMAVISIQSGYNHPTDIASFSGKNRFVSGYLINEVLQNQNPAVKQFLIQTSLLDKFCAPLCDQISGLDNSQSILEYLEQSGLFLIPLDDHRTWYRYHPLFGNLLQEKLKLLYSDSVDDLHRQAAMWFEEHACEDEAIDHWLAVREYDHVAACLQNSHHQIIASGKWSSFLNWLEQTPDEILTKHPKLLVYRVYLLWEMGQTDKFYCQMELTEAVLGPIPEDFTDLNQEILECHSILMIVKGIKQLAEHDYTQSTSKDQYMKYVNYLPEQFPLWQVMLKGITGFLQQTEGNFPEAIKCYRRAGKMALETEMTLPLFIFSTALMVLYLLTGRLTKAIRTGEILLKIDAQQNFSIPYSGLFYAVMGELLYLRGEFILAAEYTQRGIQLISNDGELYSMAYGHFILARIYIAQCDQARADKAIQSMMLSLEEMKAPRNAFIIARAYQAYIWASSGQIEPAVNWLNNTELDQFNEEEQPNIIGCSFIGIYTTTQISSERFIQFIKMTMIKTEIAAGRYETALEHLNEMSANASHSNNLYYQMQLDLLKALALYRSDQAGQEDALIASIEGIFNEPFYQLYIDEGQPMRELLEKTKVFLQKQKSPSGNSEQVPQFIDAVLKRMISPRNPTSSKNEYGITPREKMVLQQLSQGISYEEIARALVVSPNTIRTHINNLYRKMGVRNRLQAVKKANEIGLYEDLI